MPAASKRNEALNRDITSMYAIDCEIPLIHSTYEQL